MSAIDLIRDACAEEYGAILLHGRSLYDFVCDNGKIRPLFEALRRMLYREFGMLFVIYNKANGLNWFESWIADPHDRQMVRDAFQKSGMLSLPPKENETVAMLRAAAHLLRSGTADLKWHDGRPMRVGMCFEFTEHFAPCVAPGGQAEVQLVISEHIHILSQSLALRTSGNRLFFHGRLQHIDELVAGHIKKIRIPQPDKEEKAEFLKTALDIYPNARFENGIDADGVLALTTHTPNRGIENLLRASDRSGRPLTAAEIAEQKNLDVKELSEGTLRPLDTRRVHDVNLVGRNVEVPRAILHRWARMLLKNDQMTPANVLLAGGPASGKTDLTLEVAFLAQCPAYQMLSPKDGIVGGTERKARQQQDALKEWQPCVAAIDELTETFPVDRGGFNGDSGASLAVIAELLTGLSDQTRCGRSVILATTNRVSSIGPALLTRFVVLPVLFPLKQDFPSIIAEIARKLLSGITFDPSDQKLKKAGDIFYSKGAGPRHIRTALTNVATTVDGLTDGGEIALLAAGDLIPTHNFLSVVYADLQAIRHCTSKRLLPWDGDNVHTYTFPDYLSGIVDPATGDIDLSAIDRRIKELEPYSNV